MNIRILILLLVFTSIFTVSIQNSTALITVDTVCNEGKILVLRTAVQKYACVFEDTSSKWEKMGISETINHFEDTVQNFEECVKEGNPVMESFPRQCRSSDGQLFVEEIKDNDSSSEDLMINENQTLAMVPLGNNTSEILEISVSDSELKEKVENQVGLLLFKITQMQELASNPEIVNAIIDSNKRYALRDDPHQYVLEKDAEWVKTPKNTITPFMAALIENNISSMLREKSIIPTEEFGNVLFPEIILTNEYGANVAQSGRTEDFNQSDELWWIKGQSEKVQIKDVSWDPSAQIFSGDIIIKIVDNNNKFIGVLKAVTPIR